MPVDRHGIDHGARRRRAGADRAGRPLPHRQHLQGDHGDRRAAARRGRPARARRPGRRAAGGARRRDRHRPGRRGDHGPPAAVPHERASRLPQHVLRRRRRLVHDGGATGPRPRARLGAGHVPLLEPQLLPARPARRAGRRAAVRGRRHRPPAGAARHPGHAHGADVRRRPDEVVHPSAPLRNYMEVLGAAGSWVATPSDVVTIMASLDPALTGLAPAVAADARPDAATADAGLPDAPAGGTGSG